MFKLLVQRVPTLAKAVQRNTVALPVMQRRYFSDSDKKATHNEKIVPKNFFDEDLEVEREFLDFARSLEEGGLDKLTVTKHISGKSSIEKLLAHEDILSDEVELKSLNRNLRHALLAYKGLEHDGYSSDECAEEIRRYVASGSDDDRDYNSGDSDGESHRETHSIYSKTLDSDDEDPVQTRMDLEYEVEYDSDYDKRKPKIVNGRQVDSDDDDEEEEEPEEEHVLQDPEEHMFLPHGANNPTETVRRGYLYPDELLHDFIPATHSERHNSTNQGSRACPGKLQRRGRFPVLRCHKIDIDALTYLDVLTLKQFLTEDSEIIPKKGTGLCSKCQRKVAKTVKAARNFGLLPHIGQFVVSDSRPKLLRKDAVHQPFVRDIPVVISKTLL